MHGRTTTPLRIALVAPPWFPVPPQGYGGIEQLCADLANQLVARGHDVVLLAAGRAGTRARHVTTLPEPPSARVGEPLPEVLHAAQVGLALEELDVDVIHDHSLAGPLLARGRAVPTVATAHGPVTGELGAYYRALARNVGMVAISKAQQRFAPDLPWAGMVHNGIAVGDYPFRAVKEDFCLFLGRMSPEKAPHLAIDAARRAGRRIVVAAKCREPAERAYFDAMVRPRLGPGVEWIGEADTATKKDLLSRASCLVFPIQWEEPFGLVMVEALACGTPVVALRRGSVPEVVVHGETGFICDTPEELPAAIQRAGELLPARCQKDAYRRFDVSVMAAGYERVYQALLGHPTAPSATERRNGRAGWPAAAATA